jgi:Flp pilus assembly CpaF family ATPase
LTPLSVRDEDHIPAEVRDNVRRRLLDEMAGDSDRSQAEMERRVESALISEGRLWPRRMVLRLVDDLSDELFGLGPLEPLLRDPEI